MSLIKFYNGSDSDLTEKEYEEGSIYFIFPNSNMTMGHIYLDIDGVRREISASYNDTPLTNRVKALEDLLFTHCEGVAIDDTDVTVWVNDEAIFTGTISPGTTTDPIVFTSANNKVEVTSYDINKASGFFAATITGLSDGRDTITLTCGEYSDTISVLVMDQAAYTTVMLAQNYDPNGESFSWSLPSTFNFDYGQYIEASFNLTGITTVKENLLSIGAIITDYQSGPVVNFYTSQSTNAIQTKLRVGSASQNGTNKFTGLEISIPAEEDIVIRWDANGLYLNGNLLRGVNALQNTTLDIIHEQLSETTPILVGSLEGVVRSHAHYNYIKYVKYDGVV